MAGLLSELFQLGFCFKEKEVHLHYDRDRATYDPKLSAYVLYPGSENTFSGPSNFTFGPSFIELANEYPGTVVMGL